MSAEDFANRHAIDLARVEAGSVQRVRGFIGELETEIVGKIQSSNYRPGQREKFETILRESDKAISRAYKGIKATTGDDLRGIADIGGRSASRMVNAEIGVDVFGSTLTENQISALLNDKLIFGAASGEWWNGQSQALRDKFAKQMRLGYALGEDVDTLARRVRGTAANGFSDGIMQTSKREADALVRSSIQTISNAARIEGFKQLPETIKGIQWISTLDTRTTPICKALDRKVWSLPDFKPIGHDKRFPGVVAHWNCRSVQIPVLRTWAEMSGKPIKELDDATLEDKVAEKLRAKGWSEERIAKYRGRARASAEGQVSEATDYDAWLRSKPEAEIRRILGRDRAKMFLDGQITASDLTDQNNRPLTVEQLREAIRTGKRAPETEGTFPAFDRSKLGTYDETKQALAVQRSASKEIERVVASTSKADEPMTLALREVQATQPALSPAETLAKAEQVASNAAKAEKQALTLSKARDTLAEGGTLTRTQADAVKGLGEAARADFTATVEIAKSAKASDNLAAALRLYDDTGKPTAPAATVRAALDRLPDSYRAAVSEVVDGRAAAAEADDVLKAWRSDPIKAKALALVPSGKLTSAALVREATVELPAVNADTLAPLAAGKTAENVAIREITGMNAPTAPSLKRWLESSPLGPVVFLTLFSTIAKARKDREELAETVAAAKAALVAGKELTAAQRAALDDMTPAERRAFDEAVEDAKARLE